MRYFRFDVKEERMKIQNQDKLAALREIYETIASKFRSSYHPNMNLIIDERISPFKCWKKLKKREQEKHVLPREGLLKKCVGSVEEKGTGKYLKREGVV